VSLFLCDVLQLRQLVISEKLVPLSEELKSLNSIKTELANIMDKLSQGTKTSEEQKVSFLKIGKLFQDQLRKLQLRVKELSDHLAEAV
jgi:hypothetical protein